MQNFWMMPHKHYPAMAGKIVECGHPECVVTLPFEMGYIITYVNITPGGKREQKHSWMCSLTCWLQVTKPEYLNHC